LARADLPLPYEAWQGHDGIDGKSTFNPRWHLAANLQVLSGWHRTSNPFTAPLPWPGLSP